ESELVCEEITMNLAHLEQNEGHWPQAIQYLKIVKQVSPNPDAIQKQIDKARDNQTAKPSPSASTTH
ncbi:MAG: hypothetical protein WBS33_08480, partial [Verrucomicrobiia bacterium]